MSGTKSFATLNQTLLARKGGAKPAMRPQLHPLPEYHEATARQIQDDLGGDDMGADPSGDSPQQAEGAEVVSIKANGTAGPPAPGLAEVVHHQAGLSSKIAAGARPRNLALAQGRRAAFTLRLDADRHLKLRLASTVLNRSAQDIVTEALDNHLAAMGDIESLAAEIRKRR